MARYTKEVVIAYDMDAAGRTAAEKAIRLLDSVGVKTKILKLDDAKDPDEYIRRFGANKFRLRLNDSENQFDYRCNTIISAHNLEDFNDRMACISELTKLLSTLHTDVERDIYIGRLSEKLKVSPESLKNDVVRLRKRTVKQEEKNALKKELQKSEGYGDRINPEKVGNRLAASAEEVILGILLLYPENLRGITEDTAVRRGLCEDDFMTSFNRRVFSFLREQMLQRGAFDIGYLGQSFGDDEIGRIVGMQVARSRLTKNDMDVLEEMLGVLRAEKSKRTEENSLDALRAMIERKKTAGTTGE